MEPTATRSKKPESVAAEIETKRAARAAEAAYSPYTGTTVATTLIIEHTVADTVSYVIETYPADGHQVLLDGRTSYQTLMAINKYVEAAHSQPGHPWVCVYGLRIQEQLQLMAVDALRYWCIVNQQSEGGIPKIPPKLWTHPNFQTPMWRDPYNVLVPTDQRAFVKYEHLVQFYGMGVDVQGLESSPQMQAEFAQKLTAAANL